MPTPAKPVSVIRGEGKSHRTKSELNAREKAEAGTLTGVRMKEYQATQADDIAHKHFLRVKKLLASIGKDDAIYEASINRYCVLHAECRDLEGDRGRIARETDKLESAYDSGGIAYDEYFKARTKLFDQKLQLERALTSKRKALFDIERESLMTVASALRSIPKKADEDAGDDPMSALLKRKGV